jgi:hypothetical protein
MHSFISILNFACARFTYKPTGLNQLIDCTVYDLYSSVSVITGAWVKIPCGVITNY